MPIGNGGIIGPPNTPSVEGASGVWRLDEVQRARETNSWPLISASIEPLATGFSETDLATYSFNGVDFGEEASDRLLLLCAYATRSGGGTIDAASIGGVSASGVNSQGTNTIGGIFYANVPSGSSGTVSFTFSGTCSRASYALYAAYNLNSLTPTDSDAPAGGGGANRTVTLDILAGGFALICAAGVSSDSMSWSNATENLVSLASGGEGISTALVLPTANQTNLIIGANASRAIQGLAFR